MATHAFPILAELTVLALLVGCSGSPPVSSAAEASAPRDGGGHIDDARAAEDARDAGSSSEASSDAKGSKDAGHTTQNRGVQVLNPPPAGSADDEAVQKYLLSPTSAAFPTIAGAVIVVEWSDFDLGDTKTGAHTSYDFSIPDATVKPWISAGKNVNLVLQNSTYGGGAKCPSSGTGSLGSVGSDCAMPPWVWTALGSDNVTTCGATGSTQQVPNYRASVFVSSYQAAMKELVEHYGTEGGVGYIRIGLGRGGEINLPSGWDDPSDTSVPCGADYTTKWGYTVGASSSDTWNEYLSSMLAYEASLSSPKQLMVSITPVTTKGVTGATVPDFLAPIAVANHIGFGNQGLQYSDIKNYPDCGGDWCKLFAADTGKVPLELQTFGESCPAGYDMCPGDSTSDKLSNATGSLVPLLPFAVMHDATILEVYYQDWLIAYDADTTGPYAANHATYGVAYQSALEQAASKL
jgi:hypothetical protein